MAVVDPKDHSMHEVVGIMTGAVVHDIEHPDDEPNGAAPSAEQPAEERPGSEATGH